MGGAISEVLPFAIGVAISPIPLIGVILMLFTARAKHNGLVFLLGWVVGLGLLVTVVYLVADAVDVASDNTASDSTSTITVVLGVALLVGGLRRLRRPPAGAEAALPRWMAGIDGFTPVKAGGLGAALGALNPKNLALAVGAAFGLAQLGVSSGDAVAGLVAFVVVASSTTALAVGYRLVGGEGARARLDDAKGWLVLHSDAVTAVLFLVFGVVLLAQGTGRLSA